MKNILILGGTKYLGLEFYKIISNHKDFSISVASRGIIEGSDQKFIDRKDKNDLKNLLLEKKYDIIIDFICYSGSDAILLKDAIDKSNSNPHLIIISSIYVYGAPDRLTEHRIFSEEDFKAQDYFYFNKDRPEVSYLEGKRQMEAFFTQNYYQENLSIVRFPIILGHNDYTGRTRFYSDLIVENKKINPLFIENASNYIFTDEAANSLLLFCKEVIAGTFNIGIPERISEYELLNLYCEYFNKNIHSIYNKNLQTIKTPFTCPYNYIINSTKFNEKMKISESYKRFLFRELDLIYI